MGLRGALNVIHNTNNCAKRKEKNTSRRPATKRLRSRNRSAGNRQRSRTKLGSLRKLGVHFSRWQRRNGSHRNERAPTDADAQMGGAAASSPGYLKSAVTASGGSASFAARRPLCRQQRQAGGRPERRAEQGIPHDARRSEVVMEQKAIPRLLVECANSNMRIDVRAVRILAEKHARLLTSTATAANGAAATAAPFHYWGLRPERAARMGWGRAHNMMNQQNNQAPGKPAKRQFQLQRRVGGSKGPSGSVEDSRHYLHLQSAHAAEHEWASDRGVGNQPAPAATAPPGAAAPAHDAAFRAATPTAPAPATPAAAARPLPAAATPRRGRNPAK